MKDVQGKTQCGQTLLRYWKNTMVKKQLNRYNGKLARLIVHDINGCDIKVRGMAESRSA